MDVDDDDGMPPLVDRPDGPFLHTGAASGWDEDDCMVDLPPLVTRPDEPMYYNTEPYTIGNTYPNPLDCHLTTAFPMFSSLSQDSFSAWPALNMTMSSLPTFDPPQPRYDIFAPPSSFSNPLALSTWEHSAQQSTASSPLGTGQCSPLPTPPPTSGASSPYLSMFDSHPASHSSPSSGSSGQLLTLDDVPDPDEDEDIDNNPPSDDTHHVTPTKYTPNTTTISTGTHIPRPPNAFILFRSSFIKSSALPPHTLHSATPADISRIAGRVWRSLSPAQRKKWEDKAEEALRAHRERYPEWRWVGGRGRWGGGGGGGGKRKGRIKDGVGGGGSSATGTGTGAGPPVVAFSFENSFGGVDGGSNSTGPKQSSTGHAPGQEPMSTSSSSGPPTSTTTSRSSNADPPSMDISTSTSSSNPSDPSLRGSGHTPPDPPKPNMGSTTMTSSTSTVRRQRTRAPRAAKAALLGPRVPVAPVEARFVGAYASAPLPSHHSSSTASGSSSDQTQPQGGGTTFTFVTESPASPVPPKTPTKSRSNSGLVPGLSVLDTNTADDELADLNDVSLLAAERSEKRAAAARRRQKQRDLSTERIVAELTETAIRDIQAEGAELRSTPTNTHTTTNANTGGLFKSRGRGGGPGKGKGKADPSDKDSTIREGRPAVRQRAATLVAPVAPVTDLPAPDSSSEVAQRTVRARRNTTTTAPHAHTHGISSSSSSTTTSAIGDDGPSLTAMFKRPLTPPSQTSTPPAPSFAPSLNTHHISFPTVNSLSLNSPHRHRTRSPPSRTNSRAGSRSRGNSVSHGHAPPLGLGSSASMGGGPFGGFAPVPEDMVSPSPGGVGDMDMFASAFEAPGGVSASASVGGGPVRNVRAPMHHRRTRSTLDGALGPFQFHTPAPLTQQSVSMSVSVSASAPPTAMAMSVEDETQFATPWPNTEAGTMAGGMPGTMQRRHSIAATASESLTITGLGQDESGATISSFTFMPPVTWANSWTCTVGTPSCPSEGFLCPDCVAAIAREHHTPLPMPAPMTIPGTTIVPRLVQGGPAGVPLYEPIPLQDLARFAIPPYSVTDWTFPGATSTAAGMSAGLAGQDAALLNPPASAPPAFNYDMEYIQTDVAEDNREHAMPQDPTPVESAPTVSTYSSLANWAGPVRRGTH